MRLKSFDLFLLKRLLPVAAVGYDLGSACTYPRHNGWFVITRLDRVAGSQRPGRAAFSATGSTSTPRLNLIDSVQRRDVRPVSRNSVRAQRHRSRDIGNIPVAFL